MARGLALAAAVLLLLFAAAPAWAASGTYTCATLQAGINQAGQGDTITLNSSASPGGLCNAQDPLKRFPSPVAFPNNCTQGTLAGLPGQTDGFDGAVLTRRDLAGV